MLTSLDPLTIPGLNNFKAGSFPAEPHSFPCPTPLFKGRWWSRRHCLGSHPIPPHPTIPIKKRLGSFSSDPDNHLKEFKYLTQSCHLTWHDICISLCSTLLPEEKERVWQASQAHADEIHRTGDLNVGATASPRWSRRVIRQGDRDE